MFFIFLFYFYFYLCFLIFNLFFNFLNFPIYLLNTNCNSSFASHLWDNTEHVKESSDETENIPTMFSAEINLLWRLNRVWVSMRAIRNKSWQQHPTRHQLYGHLPPITKTIQVRRTRHAGHCWRSRDELIRDVLLWIPTHGRAKAGRPARTYIQQLCEDTGFCPEDLPRAMNEEWREKVRDIRATSAIWWYIYIYIYIYIYMCVCVCVYTSWFAWVEIKEKMKWKHW